MTATIEARPPVVAAATPSRSLRASEWAVVAYAGALLVVVAPNVRAQFWTPKAVLVLVALVPGLVVLVRTAYGRDRAAVAGVVLVTVAALSTALSSRPLLALLGPYNDGNGLLFVAAVVGAWALGRRLSPAGARMLGSVVLAAAVVNSVMTWLQMSSAFGAGGIFIRVDARSPGLLGNPVHATAFLVAAFALAVERSREPVGRTRDRRLAYFAACALFASGVQLSGGRTGLVLLALVIVLALARGGWRTAGFALVLGVVGVAAASVAYPSDAGAAARLAGSNRSNVLGRVDRWEMALPAVADRPVLGVGPGLYRRATSPHDTAAAARAFGADALYQDAHNLFVEYAVTLGLVGLAALAMWLALSANGARGELVWFAAFGGISLMLQPQFVGLTPVLAMALGAAAPRDSPSVSRRAQIAARTVAILGAVVGCVVAVMLVRGDVQFDRSVARRSPVAAHRAVQLLTPWPDPAGYLASLEFAHPHKRGASARALKAARVMLRRDDTAPAAWALVGQIELGRGRSAVAERAYREALRWDPESASALLGLARLAHQRGDAAEVAARCRTVLSVNPDAQCPPRG